MAANPGLQSPLAPNYQCAGCRICPIRVLGVGNGMPELLLLLTDL
jgi:hypothetical protein